MSRPSAIADWFEHRPINATNRAAFADEIRARLDFVGIAWAGQRDREVRMLDYACGMGFLSRVRTFHHLHRHSGYQTGEHSTDEMDVMYRFSRHMFRAL